MPDTGPQTHVHWALPVKLDADPATAKFELLRAALAAETDIDRAIIQAARMWDFVQGAEMIPVRQVSAPAPPTLPAPDPRRDRRPFTAQEDAEILRLHRDGVSVNAIRKFVDRSWSTVKKRIDDLTAQAAIPALAVAPAEPAAEPPSPPYIEPVVQAAYSFPAGAVKDRECIACLNRFVPTGPTNKLCAKCRRKD